MANKKQKNAQARLDEMIKKNKKASQKSYVFSVIIIAVIVLLVGVCVYGVFASSNSSSDVPQKKIESNKTYKVLDKNTVWHKEMLLGDENAKNHFVEYSDIMCPWCAKFSTQIKNHLAELKQKYLDTNEVSLEFRLTDYLTTDDDSKGADNSTRAGERVYCALHQNKFWEFYESLIAKLNEDYYDKGIGYHGGPQVPVLADEYYNAIAQNVGLDMDGFKKCIDDKVGYDDIKQSTQSAAYDTGNKGLPFFRFNKYTNSGFDGNWETIEKMLEAGLASK